MGVSALAALVAAVSVAAGPHYTVRWSKVDAVSGFTGWRQELQHLADQDGRTRTNHFCIVAASYKGRPPAGSVVWAYVHWREANELYTFGQSVDVMTDEVMVRSAPLNLKTDVTRRPGSSTYLVTPQWVHNILSHCASDGETLIVERAHG